MANVARTKAEKDRLSNIPHHKKAAEQLYENAAVADKASDQPDDADKTLDYDVKKASDKGTQDGDVKVDPKSTEYGNKDIATDTNYTEQFFRRYKAFINN